MVRGGWLMRSSTEGASPSSALLVTVEAQGRGADPVEWGVRNEQWLKDMLHSRGAVLLRGFRVNGVAHFERFIADVFGQSPLGYRNQSTPRTAIRGNIYSSTEYPADQFIPLHNENAYSTTWARKILFHCVKVSESGGETPIADSRRVLERIPVATRERFERHGVLYVRHYDGLDLPWQTVFQTEDPREAERQCRESGIDYAWDGFGCLQTREVAQATLAHPETGEQVWFNQAHLFHVSSLPTATRDALLAAVGEARLPRNAYYGNGSEITEQDLSAIRAAYDAETVTFSWQAGDILILDNVLVAHGRRPFAGARKIVVGMVESYTAPYFPKEPFRAAAGYRAIETETT